MTNTMSEKLARRAVACPGWRWMPGMLGLSAKAGLWRVEQADLTALFGAGAGPASIHEVGAWLPDLTDPATLGCLLALVREAWGDSAMSVTAGYTKDRKVEWEVEHPHPDSLPEALWTYFDTEAEALVAALETAP
jgi:hypothetical protein